MNAPSARRIDSGPDHPAHRSLLTAAKLTAAIAGSSNILMRVASRPIWASLGFALGYLGLGSTLVFGGAYLILTGRVASNAAKVFESSRQPELLTGLGFLWVTGVVGFWSAFRLQRRISAQQQRLALIFDGVSDSLFLLQVEAGDGCRIQCVNAAFLRLTGLARDQIDGKRIEEVLPATSLAFVKERYREAIRERRPVTWEESATYPAGRRVAEVTLAPLTEMSGAVRQLAGVIRDVTGRMRATERCEAYGRRLQTLSRRLVEVQEVERRHLARELHDEIGQALTVAQLNLQAVLQSSDPGSQAPRLTESLEAVERVLDQVHDISLNLRPPMLDDLGLEPTLRWYTRRQAALAGLTADFAADPLPHRLEPIIETECFRIAQEALTNVTRHARARSVSVSLRTSADRLHLGVRDDGVGFDVAPVREQAVFGASLGLLGMEERASLAGGGLEFRSVPGEGTEVLAWFPLKPQSSATGSLTP